MYDFRPHHFMCSLGFEGKGYSKDFVAGYEKIVRDLREHPNGDQVRLRVVSQTDSICEPCPNRRGTLCESQGKIDKLDDAHAAALGLKAGDVLTWGEVKARIAEKITDEVFERICEPCGWKPLGLCQTALDKNRV